MADTDFERELGSREGYTATLSGQGRCRSQSDFHSFELFSAYFDGWCAGVWDAAGELVASDEVDNA